MALQLQRVVPDLQAQHRPKSFSAFVGLDDAIERARSLLVAGGAVVLYGPTGTGKTALAEVLAQAFLCDSREGDGSPCGRCPSCRGVRGDTLSGSYTYLNGPDDGRVKPVSDAVAEAGDGRPNVIVMDNADQVAAQTLLLLQPLVDRRSRNALVVLIVRDSDGLLQREPGLAWRYDWIELPRVSQVVMHGYLTGLTATHGLALDELELALIVTRAGGSIAVMLRCLQSHLNAAYGLPATTTVMPAADVAEGVLKRVLAGERVTDLKSVTRQWEAVRHEIESALGSCLAAIRNGQHLQGIAEDLFGVCELLARRHNVNPAACAEQFIAVWAGRARHLSEAGFVAALSRTERLVASARLGESDEKACSAAPVQIQRFGTAGPGRYLSAAQFVKLTNHCAKTMRRHGSTVRLEANVRHDDQHDPARYLGVLTHGLSMFMSKRREMAPAWFYLHHMSDQGPETILALMAKAEQIDAIAEWLAGRTAVCNVRTCRDSDDERRLAFQQSVLRKIGTYLDPTLGWREADGSIGRLRHFIGVPVKSTSALGAPFTARAIGISGRHDDDHHIEHGGRFGSLVSAFTRDPLVDWRERQRRLIGDNALNLNPIVSNPWDFA